MKRGNVNPVTVLSAGPVVVRKLRPKRKMAMKPCKLVTVRKVKNINKPMRGHIKRLG